MVTYVASGIEIMRTSIAVCRSLDISDLRHVYYPPIPDPSFIGLRPDWG
ncbi:MAG: hypothetical protein WC556_12630 [Candidatus Methanoperedens sp.]